MIRGHEPTRMGVRPILSECFVGQLRSQPFEDLLVTETCQISSPGSPLNPAEAAFMERRRQAPACDHFRPGQAARYPWPSISVGLLLTQSATKRPAPQDIDQPTWPWPTLRNRLA